MKEGWRRRKEGRRATREDKQGMKKKYGNINGVITCKTERKEGKYKGWLQKTETGRSKRR